MPGGAAPSHDAAFAAFRAKRDAERAAQVKVTWRKVSPMTGGGWSALGPDGALGFVNPKRPSGYEYGLRDGKDKPVAGVALTLARAKAAVEQMFADHLHIREAGPIVQAVNNVNTHFTGGTKMTQDAHAQLQQVYMTVFHAFAAGVKEIAADTGLTESQVRSRLTKLQHAGLVDNYDVNDEAQGASRRGQYGHKVWQANETYDNVNAEQALATFLTAFPAPGATPTTTTTAAPTARKEATVATTKTQDKPETTEAITAEQFAGSIEGVDAVRAAKAPTARLRANGKTLAYADDRKGGFVLSIAAEAIEPLPAKEKAKVEIKGRRATLRVTTKNAKGAAALVAALAKRAA